MTEDEMVGWHHQHNRHGFEWTLGVNDRQGGLACCSPWGRKESDMTERLNWTELRSENYSLAFGQKSDFSVFASKRLTDTVVSRKSSSSPCGSCHRLVECPHDMAVVVRGKLPSPKVNGLKERTMRE